MMVANWDDVKIYISGKCNITIAFIAAVFFELVRVTILLLGVWAFIYIAGYFGLENNIFIQLLHEFSLVGFTIIYIIVLVYGIIDFHRIFNKPNKLDKQTTLKDIRGDYEDGGEKK
jgi:hypothetical protein